MYKPYSANRRKTMLTVIGLVALVAVFLASLNEGPTRAYVDHRGNRVEASPSRLKWFAVGIVSLVIVLQIVT